ncbi:hypothetical protein ACHAPQ_011506 [Fusarium lateritium]
MQQNKLRRPWLSLRWRITSTRNSQPNQAENDRKRPRYEQQTESSRRKRASWQDRRSASADLGTVSLAKPEPENNMSTCSYLPTIDEARADLLAALQAKLPSQEAALQQATATLEQIEVRLVNAQEELSLADIPYLRILVECEEVEHEALQE